MLHFFDNLSEISLNFRENLKNLSELSLQNTWNEVQHFIDFVKVGKKIMRRITPEGDFLKKVKKYL